VGSDVLLDTEVFIDHIRGARRFQSADRAAFFSTVTRAELFAGRTSDARLGRLLLGFNELVVDRRTAELGGRIKRVFGLAMVDALIAGTALIHDLELVSRDRQFARVPGLRLRESL
jgi:predicted nucleic acid-binding protein